MPGARVRVRFAGRLRDGFVLERLATSDSDRELSPLSKVTSAEPVLTPEIAALVRAVADHYAGCFADVLRLADPAPARRDGEGRAGSAAAAAGARPDTEHGGALGVPDRSGSARRAARPGAARGRTGR